MKFSHLPDKWFVKYSYSILSEVGQNKRAHNRPTLVSEINEEVNEIVWIGLRRNSLRNIEEKKIVLPTPLTTEKL